MLLALFSGIFTGILFVLPKLSYLAFFTLIPLIIKIKQGNVKFIHGFLYGFSLNLISMFFITSIHPLDFLGLDGFKSLVVTISAYLGICVYEGIMWGFLFFLFGKYIKRIWLFPVFYAICEYILSVGAMGLSFSHLYLPFYEKLLFIQSAGEMGPHFLTLLILTLSIFIYKGISENRKYLVWGIVIFILNMTYGYFTLNQVHDDGLNHNISVIQGNISTNDKWENSNIYKILDTYTDLSKSAIKNDGSEVIVWPETVVPVSINKDNNVFKEMSTFAKENNVHIITGAFWGEEKVTNSVIVIDNEGKYYEEIYNKRHLIPFTELTSLTDNKIKKGKEGTVIKTDVGNIGALVCIDSAYSRYAGKTMKNKPDYLVVLSNDSWFGNSYGVYNHYAHSVFRAIESRKYLIRCANTGISSIISPTGEIINKILPERKGYITYEK